MRSVQANLDKEQNKNYLALNAITLYFNTLSLEKILLANQQKVAFLNQLLKDCKNFTMQDLALKINLKALKPNII